MLISLNLPLGGVPPRTPRSDRVSANDSDDMVTETLRDEIVDGRDLAFRLAYEDAKGDVTERSVRILSVDLGSTGGTILTWCFLRSAYRRFRADRVQEMWWLDTGEVIDDPGEFFRQLGEAAPEASALSALKPGLKILAWIARADGDFHHKEVQVMVDFAEDCSGRVLDREQLTKQFRALYPAPSAVLTAIRQVKNWLPERKRELLRAVDALVAADGEHTIDEFERASEVKASI